MLMLEASAPHGSLVLRFACVTPFLLADFPCVAFVIIIIIIIVIVTITGQDFVARMP
jgi:hypothetical protein